MNKSDSHSPALMTETEAEMSAYRSPHRLAVTALVLALASPLTLVSPLLWILPGVAAILAVVARRQVAANPNQYTGLGISAVALALSLACLAMGPAQYFSQQQFMYRTATKNAEQWLELVGNGDLQRAHQLVLKKPERVETENEIAVLYSTNATKEREMNEYFSNDFARELVEAGDDAEYVFVAGKRISQYRRDNYVTLQFSMSRENSGTTKTTLFNIVMARTPSDDKTEASWRVSNVYEDDGVL